MASPMRKLWRGYVRGGRSSKVKTSWYSYYLSEWEDEAQTVSKEKYKWFLELREERLKKKENEQKLIDPLPATAASNT